MCIGHKKEISLESLSFARLSDINMNRNLDDFIRHNSIKIELLWLYRHIDIINEDDIIYIYININT